jgi:hypothetical protein
MAYSGRVKISFQEPTLLKLGQRVDLEIKQD